MLGFPGCSQGFSFFYLSYLDLTILEYSFKSSLSRVV